VGKIYKIEDYSQESGRAGRDGNPSEALVFSYISKEASKKREPIISTTPIPTNVEVLDIKDYLSGAFCRRIVLDFVLDGRRDRSSCEAGEEFCDICSKRFSTTTTTTTNISSRGISPASLSFSSSPTISSAILLPPSNPSNLTKLARDSELIRLRIGLSESFESFIAKELRTSYTTLVERGCFICFLNDEKSRFHEPWYKCPLISKGAEDFTLYKEAKIVEDNLRQSSTILGFQPYAGCIDCFFPQDICSAWELIEGEGKAWKKVAACRARGLLLPTFLSFLLLSDSESTQTNSLRLVQLFFRQREKKELDLKIGLKGYKSSYNALWKFLRRRRIFSGLEASELAFLFSLIWAASDKDYDIVEIPEFIEEALNR
jgi:hypothetical protein